MTPRKKVAQCGILGCWCHGWVYEDQITTDPQRAWLASVRRMIETLDWFRSWR